MSDRANHSDRSAVSRFAALVPGIALCALVSIVATGLQWTEEALVGFPYVEALVIAILLGMFLRAVWTPGPMWGSGIAFTAKQLLELAVAFLGASITFSSLIASGLTLLGAIVSIVLLMLMVSYAISRALGLSKRLSVLIACGNSICGNSAIAAVAPVIGATSDEIASSISFTALLGVIVVVGLPLLIPIIGFTEAQYGFLAGMTVYAVPQVLAATMPVGLVSTQMGTLVKLVRVMMLGPIVTCIAIFARRLQTSRNEVASGKPGIFRTVPWFIVAFVLLAALRSLDLLSDSATLFSQKAATILTLLAMAALGLGVDPRVIGQVGARVTAAVTLSLACLLGLSLILVRVVLPA